MSLGPSSGGALVEFEEQDLVFDRVEPVSTNSLAACCG